MITERQYPEIVGDLIAISGADASQAAVDARRELVSEAHEAAQDGRFEVAEPYLEEADDIQISPTQAYTSAVRQLTQLDPTDRSPHAIALRRAALNEASARAKSL